MQRSFRLSRTRVVGAVALVALLVAMALNTRFVTPEELASIGPQTFDPRGTARKLFQQAGDEFASQAAPLDEVVTGVQKDPGAAASEYGAKEPNSTTFIFQVKGTGTVVAATPDTLELKVDGVPAQTPVLVPLTTAVNGTVVRDATGFKFADAPDQSDYQRVGDEVKELMIAAISQDVGDPARLKGERVDFVGAISVPVGSPVPAAKPVNVQVISVQPQ